MFLFFVELMTIAFFYTIAVLIIYFKALERPIYWVISLSIFILTLIWLKENSNGVISEITSATVGYFILVIPVNIIILSISYEKSNRPTKPT